MGGSIGGHQDDGGFGVELANGLEGLQTTHPPHPNIHDDDIWAEFFQQSQPLFTAGGHLHLQIGHVKDALEGVAHIGLIVYDE